MRPVVKGTAPAVYGKWGDARNDLADRIGWYCSYCEMGVTQMIEVEHIVPRDHGGAPLSWDNFLLSCKYCNTIKSNRNKSRNGYIWPDRDNSDFAFVYSERDVITPASGISATEPMATIDLMGLDRRPGGKNEPTDADSRWIHRLQTWLVAKQSFDNWKSCPTEAMADQIAKTAKGYGFYSIWLTVFRNEPQVVNAIQDQFPNTYRDVDSHGVRRVRTGGVL